MPTPVQPRAATKSWRVRRICSDLGDSSIAISPSLAHERSKDGEAPGALDQRTGAIRQLLPSGELDALPKLGVSDLKNGDQYIVTSRPKNDASRNAHQQSTTTAATLSGEVHYPFTRLSETEPTGTPFFKNVTGKPRDLKAAVHNVLAQMERLLNEKCEEDDGGIYGFNILMYRLDLASLDSSRQDGQHGPSRSGWWN